MREGDEEIGVSADGNSRIEKESHTVRKNGVDKNMYGQSKYEEREVGLVSRVQAVELTS